MKIEFVGNKIGCRLKRDIKKAVKLTLKNLQQESKPLLLSITFLNNEDMQELNSRTRNINKVTDVLSYPNFNLKTYDVIDIKDQDNYTSKYIILGDMAICLEKAKLQAEEYEHSLKEEVIKLVIHSVLHLMGFDHIEDSDYEIMHQEEEKIAREFYKKN